MNVINYRRYPLISIIVPAFNVKQYLDRCIQSLIKQSYYNIEIVLIDDGSNDGSELLCDRYGKQDARVKVLHKANGGLSDARNYGINHSCGEYIICVDSDDYVDSDYVEYLYHLIQKYHTQMAICQHRICFSNGKIKDLGAEGDEKLDNKTCIERMLYHDVIDTSAWAKIYHKLLFDTVKYPKGKLFEDIATTYALMLECDYIAVGYEAKYNYIFRRNSIVNGEFNEKKLDLLEMTDDMANHVLEVYPDLKKAVERRRVYARFSTLNQMLNVDEYREEKKKIISFIKKNGIEILKDRRVPKRDKIGILLLKINYNLYRMVWNKYKNLEND